MTATTYNGWTNYETWRVNLEIFDGYDPDGRLVCPFELQDYAEEIIEGQAEAHSLALDYASYFEPHPVNKSFRVYVYARDREHAVKIAAEKFAKAEAIQAGIA